MSRDVSKCRAGLEFATFEEISILRRDGLVSSCYRPTGRITRVGGSSAGGSSAAIVRRLTAAREFLALERQSFNREEAAYEVSVVNARTGLVRTRPTGSILPGSRTGFATGIGPTTDLVVDRRGTAAWIAEDVRSAPNALEVHVFRGARPRRVARGTRIADGSLSLGRDRVHWIERGLPRSASIR